MPKAARSAPLNCLLAINKPTGMITQHLLNKLQPLLASSTLFKDPNAVHDLSGGKGSRKRKWRSERVKLGQGGTLDPLADGVLVIGINNATKQLSKFLDCTKEYRAIGLLGCATDSYDSDGKRVRMAPFADITAEKVEAVLSAYRGEITQVPPIFSALKMDGKPLYEYARNNLPLPRPVASRKCTVHELSLLQFTPGGLHPYEFPKETLGAKEIAELGRLQTMVKEGGTLVAAEEAVAEEVPASVETGLPPIFEIRMTVSSGTYVRSIIHDIGIALGSSAHVVKLTRTRQGEFTLDPSAVVPLPPTINAEGVEVPAPMVETFAGGCVEWEVIERGCEELEKRGKEEKKEEEGEGDGLLEWEREVLHRCKEV